ncbi:MAG: hypothetical protein KatS3mg031_2563 [Chitinophagales bacterium]|nr:MAG: hypothetical protein KatS3mg031_2563 [Chitinophagales bacterium]
MKSLDPRINRLKLPDKTEPLAEREYWQTYEVFHQEKRGRHHVHVGSVHAPNAEMALIFAKEQFGRRKRCVNMWVVKTADIHAFSLEDEDIFSTTPEKIHREASGYRVADRITQFKTTQ